MVVWAMFGDKIKQRVNENRSYQEMKSQIMGKLESAKEMTEAKYFQIVDEVSSTYSKAKGISQHELSDMVSDLKFHWARIKDRWNEPPSNNTGKIAGSDNNLSGRTDYRA
jgi:hypothetical protein